MVAMKDNIECVRCLHPLEPPERSAFARKHDADIAFPRPLLAVVEGAGEAGLNVNLLSLKTFEYVHTLKFQEQVMDVSSNAACVAVSTVSAVYVFDALTFETIIAVPYDPRDDFVTAPIALGSRFLAISGLSAKAFLRSNDENKAVLGDDWSLVTGARGLEVGVDFLGKVGSAALSWTKETVGPHLTGASPRQPTGETPGSLKPPRDALLTVHGPNGHEVAILDIKPVYRPDSEKQAGRRCNAVGYFPAYAKGIGVAAMAWSPSGDMLATAPEDGRTLNVYSIHPEKGRNTIARQLLYKHQRGLTRAKVTRLQFSNDCRWVAMSTARGTTHLFTTNRPNLSRASVNGATACVVEAVLPTPQTHCGVDAISRPARPANSARSEQNLREETNRGGISGSSHNGIFSTSPIAFGNYLLGLSSGNSAAGSEEVMPGYLKELRSKTQEDRGQRVISQQCVGRIYHAAEARKYVSNVPPPAPSTKKTGRTEGSPGQIERVAVASGVESPARQHVFGATIMVQDRRQKGFMVINISPGATLHWVNLEAIATDHENMRLEQLSGGAKRVPLLCTKQGHGTLEESKPTIGHQAVMQASDASEELLANAEMRTNASGIFGGQELPLWALPKFNIKLMRNSGLTRKTSGSFSTPWWWKYPIQSKAIKQTQLGPLPQNVVPLPTPSAPMFEMDDDSFGEVLIGRVRDAKESELGF